MMPAPDREMDPCLTILTLLMLFDLFILKDIDNFQNNYENLGRRRRLGRCGARRAAQSGVLTKTLPGRTLICLPMMVEGCLMRGSACAAILCCCAGRLPLDFATHRVLRAAPCPPLSSSLSTFSGKNSALGVKNPPSSVI